MKLSSILKIRPICLTTMFLLVFGCKENHQLTDDFAWMNNTYNPHKEISNAFGHGTTGWYSPNIKENTESLEFGTIETFSNEGCILTIKTEPDKTAKLLQESQIYVESIKVVDLRDIDPESITTKTYSHYGGFDCSRYSKKQRDAENMNCDHAEMAAITRNAEPLVSVDNHTVWDKLVGKDH